MAEIKLGKKTAYTTILTPKGELKGYSAIFEPSTKFDKKGLYNANILLSKEEGEAILALAKEVQKTQFKEFKKGKEKLAEIQSIKPFSTIDDDGKEILDEEGRYILKTKNSARIKDGVAGFKVAVFDSKVKPVKKVNIGEGSIVKLKCDISGYNVGGKVGVSIRLVAVQIIKFVAYSGTNAAEGFEEEAEGFEYGEDELEEENSSSEAEENEEDEEEDF